MIPLSEPNISGNEGQYLQECVTSTFVSTVGKFVNQFEVMVADYNQASHAIATSSGTAALHIALIQAGVKPTDIVISTSFTFIATTNAIKYCGALPWFIDIDPFSWNLNPELLQTHIEEFCDVRDGELFHTSSNRRVAAVLPVHVLGLPCDMRKIHEICRRYKLPLIADAAAALGAYFTYENTKEPLGKYSDMSCFSFNGNKIVTSGGGGAVITASQDRALHLKHLSTTARCTPDYIHDQVGYNYRMTNLEAAVGCAQMEQLDIFLARKIEIQNIYNRFIEEHHQVLDKFPTVAYAKGNNWLSGVVFKKEIGNQEKIEHRLSQIRKVFREEQIDVRSFWVPTHLQAPHRDSLYTSLFCAEDVYYRIMPLPCSTTITNAQLDLVLQVLTRCLETYVYH